MRVNYGIVESDNGRMILAEFYFAEERVLACIEVNMIITNSLSYDPTKAHIEDVKQNLYKRIGDTYVKKSHFIPEKTWK